MSEIDRFYSRLAADFPETRKMPDPLTYLTDRYGPPFRGAHPDANQPETVAMLRLWAVENGVPADAATGDPAYKLAAAYANQTYLTKWADGAAREGRGSRRRGPRPTAASWDDDAPASPALPPDSKWDASQPKAPRPDPSTPITSTADALARAADSVIAPRLERIRTDLSRTITAKVIDRVNEAARTEVERKFTSAAIKFEADIGKIIATANSTLQETVATAVSDAISRGLPSRLEIVAGDRTLRSLPAEPRHAVFDSCFRWLSSGENVYLVGNAGTGKTHLFKQLGVALGRKTTILGQALTKYEFSGYMSPTGEYVGTLLRTAVEEGHLLCIDEIDMSAAAAVGFLNSLTANRYVAFPDRMIEAHEDFIVIAAANTYGRGPTAGFVGHNPLDAASLDRFSYVEVPYDADMELQLYGQSPWLTYVHRVRAAVEDLKLRHIISMRAVARGMRGIAAGFTAEEVCFSALWRGLDDDTISKIKSKAGEFSLAAAVREEQPMWVEAAQ